jgi:formate dehydrogenase maturation protein FdhE
MNLFQSATREYDARIQRAKSLAAAQPASAEILNFYSAIAQFQKSLHAHIAADKSVQAAVNAIYSEQTEASAHQTGQIAPANSAVLRQNFDITVVLPHYRAFLHLVETHAPALLAQAACNLSARPPESWIAQLTLYWNTAGLAVPGQVVPDQVVPDPVVPGHGVSRESSDSHRSTSLAAAPTAFEQFFSRAFLEPYAEFLGQQSPNVTLLVTATRCPLCNSHPYMGVLRVEGDSGKRFLVCSFCSQEWEFRRILCPHCGESAEPKLPVYVPEQFPHLRVEACDTCKNYLLTVDLTKNGHAIPIVDDLSALPLTLWAHNHAYSRPHPNLLGT